MKIAWTPFLFLVLIASKMLALQDYFLALSYADAMGNRLIFYVDF